MATTFEYTPAFLVRNRIVLLDTALIRTYEESNLFIVKLPHYLYGHDEKDSVMKLTWLRIILLNFFIASFMGFSLRLMHLVEISWLDFKNVMHAHSHVAMMGWLFLILYGLILERLLPAEESKKRIYTVIFWVCQFSVLGMMFSFPVQGYGSISIAFTTLHLIISYFVAIRFLRILMGVSGPASVLIKTALFFMILSTFGVWSLGMIKAGLIGNAALYYGSIQFFLHFQFNGWFTFAALAFVFHHITESGCEVNSKSFNWFYGLMLVSVLLTFALSVAWSAPENWLFWTNGAGVLIQLAGLIVFVRIVQPIKQLFLNEINRLQGAIFLLALLSFSIKIFIQTVVVIPEVAVISYTIRQFVVGFIHLSMLGSITMFLVGYLVLIRKLNATSSFEKLGLIFLCLGFVISEIILFGQGLLLWLELGFAPYYYEVIAWVSGLLPIAVIMMILPLFLNRKIEINQ